MTGEKKEVKKGKKHWKTWTRPSAFFCFDFAFSILCVVCCYFAFLFFFLQAKSKIDAKKEIEKAK